MITLFVSFQFAIIPLMLNLCSVVYRALHATTKSEFITPSTLGSVRNVVAVPEGEPKRRRRTFDANAKSMSTARHERDAYSAPANRAVDSRHVGARFSDPDNSSMPSHQSEIWQNRPHAICHFVSCCWFGIVVRHPVGHWHPLQVMLQWLVKIHPQIGTRF